MRLRRAGRRPSRRARGCANAWRRAWCAPVAPRLPQADARLSLGATRIRCVARGRRKRCALMAPRLRVALLCETACPASAPLARPALLTRTARPPLARPGRHRPPWHSHTAPPASKPHLARRRGTFCFDSAHADNDHTVIETFRAISDRGGSSCNRDGSTPSECSDEESGELHDVVAIHLVKPVSRRPSARISSAFGTTSQASFLA